jgi:hypothetical protein
MSNRKSRTSDDDVAQEFVQDLLELVTQSIVANEHTNAAIIRLQEQQKVTADDLKQLLTLVRDGNGRPPLISRLEALERTEQDIQKKNAMSWEILLVALPGILAFLSTMGAM